MIIPDSDAQRNLGDGLLEMGWLLVAILVPQAVNLWARQPFELPKALLLRTLAWLLAGLWLAHALLRPGGGHPPQRALRCNPLLWPALALAAAQTVATLLAADRGLSLWGSYERAQGLLTQLGYLLLFLVVAARLRTVERARRLVAAMAVSGAPLVALGLAQALGWQPLDLMTDARSPVFATLGRSNFLGAYLALLLPLTAALTLLASRQWQRLAAAGLLLGELLVIALTRARGAWLAAAVALAAFGLLWLWPRLARRWRWAAVALGLAATLGGLAGALWLGREGGSEAARLTIWQATLDLIGQRPLLGHGPDALGLVFPRVYPPELVYYQGRGLAVDRAHNLLLDWAATTGLLGLLAGLALLGAFFLVGSRVLRTRSGQWRLLVAACLAAVAGNVAGNLVSFDVTATAAATWLLMAIVAALAGRVDVDNVPPSPSPSPRGGERLPLPWGRGPGGGRDRLTPNPIPKRERLLHRLGAALLLAGVVAAIVQFNLRPLAADVAAQTGDRQAIAGDWPGAIDAQERAVHLWPFEPVHHQALSWAYLQRAVNRGPDPWLGRAEAALLAARDLRPGDHRTWAALGELYGVWGIRWDPAKLPLAHDAYRQATALAPNHAILYTGWGLVHLEAGDLAGAAARFRQAVDLDATDGYAWRHLGDAELAQGHVKAAVDAYRQAVRWESGLVPAYVGLARGYSLLGQREAAESALQQALALDPDHPAVRALQEELGGAP